MPCTQQCAFRNFTWWRQYNQPPKHCVSFTKVRRWSVTNIRDHSKYSPLYSALRINIGGSLTMQRNIQLWATPVPPHPPPPGQTVNILETKMQDSVKLHVRVHTALERDSCSSHGPPAGNLPKDIFPHSSLTCSPPTPDQLLAPRQLVLPPAQSWCTTVCIPLTYTVLCSSTDRTVRHLETCNDRRRAKQSNGESLSSVDQTSTTTTVHY